MNIGIGTDIQSDAKFQKKYEDNETFYSRIFLPAELKYCFSKKYPSQHLGVRFCGKEAVIKALNLIGEAGFHYKDIEVTNSKSSVPGVVLHKPTKEKYDIKISLSHSQGVCLAVAIVIKTQNG